MKICPKIAATLFAIVILLNDGGRLSAQFAQPNGLGQPIEFSTPESQIVDSSSVVVQEIMAIPGRGIPASLLANAEGLAILPGMIKGGFVIGAKHGRGVVLIRDPVNGWQLPQFITITGGSVGWQIGIQATDLILVFKSKKSIQGLMSGTFTIGADAAAAAGPVGREASASTDATLKAEIYSYSRSRGLFAGVALDGSALKMDTAATSVYYQPRIALAPGQQAPIPQSAVRLINEINKYTKPGNNVLAEPAPIAAAGYAGAVEQAGTQQKLAASAQKLNAILDDRWKSYLALPAEIYSGDRLPSPEALALSLSHFQAVASNPQYSALAQRPEFVETSQLLQQMLSSPTRSTLALPPPPR